jgi:hypothetical protein
MHKLLSLLTIFLITFGLVACGSGEQSKEKAVSESATEHKADEKVEEKVAAEEEKPKDTIATTETTKESPAQTSSDSQQNQASTTVNSTTTASADSKQQTNNNNTPTAKANPAPASTSQTTANTAPAAPATESQKPATTVTFSIVGPDNHVILAPTKVKFSDGDTVFELLKQLDNQHSFVVVSRGSGATTYIEGIEGSDFSYFEFDNGPTSGWVFKQNGASLTKSVGVTAVKDGDRIEGIYTK